MKKIIFIEGESVWVNPLQPQCYGGALMKEACGSLLLGGRY
jgi:hypothetical protein